MSTTALAAPDDEPEDRKAVSVKILREIRELVKNKPERKRPPGWGRRSVPTYYREKFGLEVRAVLDALAEDKKDRIYYYDKFKGQFTPDSLYLYINQAIRYVKDHLDTPERDYAMLLDRIAITRERGVGIRLSIHKDIDSSKVDVVVNPDLVKSKSEVRVLKQQIEDWLEVAQIDDRFEADKLALSEEEVQDLKDSFIGIESIALSITQKYIKIQKIK